jgi:hypothetical protein
MTGSGMLHLGNRCLWGYQKGVRPLFSNVLEIAHCLRIIATKFRSPRPIQDLIWQRGIENPSETYWQSISSDGVLLGLVDEIDSLTTSWPLPPSPAAIGSTRGSVAINPTPSVNVHKLILKNRASS